VFTSQFPEAVGGEQEEKWRRKAVGRISPVHMYQL
jgi:hypothetical protein